MSINSRLTQFAQKDLVLGYSYAERQRINTSISQLEGVLKRNLSGRIKELIRFGSYTRNTILPRKYDSQSDIDLLLVFDTSSGRLLPNSYRQSILNALAAAYPRSVVKKSFPTVRLELNHIMFDVVPAYSQEFFGKSYYIPGSTDQWMQTWPNDINSDLSSKNQSYGNNVVRNVIRLCKHWNASAGYPFQSYIMEKRIVNTFFWAGDDLFAKYLSVMDTIAGQRAGVRQALDHIQKYKGDWFTQADEQKQWQWLKRLLPGLV